MDDIKKPSSPAEVLPETPDFTSSITETDVDDPVSKRKNDASSLLGDKALKAATKPQALLRLSDGVLRAPLAAALKTEAYQPRRRSDEVPVPVILGPFDESELASLAESGFLKSSDAIITDFGRWKLVREVFPDAMAAQKEDFTRTSTETGTATATRGEMDDDDDGEGTSTTTGGLELEAVDETQTGTAEAPLEATGEDEVFDAEPLPLELTNTEPGADEDFGGKPRTKKAEPVPEAPREKKAAPKPTAKRAAPAAPKVAPAPAPTPAPISIVPKVHLPWAGLVTAVVAVGAIFYLARKSGTATPEMTVEVPGRPGLLAAEWPANLRPLTVETLHSDDEPLVRKIRPILNAYEAGSTALSPGDERTLREVADPASASFEARKLAANQLGVYYLASSRVDDARSALKPILDADGSDPQTLLNVSLLQLTTGEYAEARESATTALRLLTTGAPAVEPWIAYGVAGLVEGYRGRLDQAEQHFKDALRRSPDNFFIYGLWARTFSDRPSYRDKVVGLMREALWTNPDRMLDSPIRAPLAAHILMAFGIEGITKGAEAAQTKLSPGKTTFLKWVEGTYRRNPLTQPVGKVAELLSQEDDPQSQMLLAYLMRRQGRLDDASQILNRILPQLHSRDDVKSSFPWAFAGDVQIARRNISQGVVFYQNAIVRNPQDIDAVYGMALAFRESGDFKLAEEKLAETQRLNPFFVPAALRVSRFEWEDGARP